MPTTMPIEVAGEVFGAQLDYDQDEDRFSGLVEIEEGKRSDWGALPGGWVSFHGRDPLELRRSFRAALRAHALTRAA